LLLTLIAVAGVGFLPPFVYVSVRFFAQ